MINDDSDGRLPSLLELYSAFQVAEEGEVLVALVLRRKDGSRVAKPYHWLSEAEYLPNLGVRLVYPSGTFTVSGRNLLGLFSSLSTHSVRQIWEADRATALLAPEDAPVVEAIDYTLS